MRIVTWNCAGALRRKTAAADALGADILVIQECEDPARSGAAYAGWAGSHVWAGRLKHKGIGVFARNGARIDALDWDDAGLAHFLPVRIDGCFDLLAVWTQAVVPTTYSYIGQFWKYLERHRAALGPESLICGDLNSNAIWDRKTRHWNHSDCVRVLGDSGFVSLYHAATGEAQGAETRPTFFLQRNAAKPFHIDHVFAHASRVPPGWSGLRVGEPQDGLALSDHMPVIVDL